MEESLDLRSIVRDRQTNFSLGSRGGHAVDMADVMTLSDEAVASMIPLTPGAFAHSVDALANFLHARSHDARSSREFDGSIPLVNGCCVHVVDTYQYGQLVHGALSGQQVCS